VPFVELPFVEMHRSGSLDSCCSDGPPADRQCTARLVREPDATTVALVTGPGTAGSTSGRSATARSGDTRTGTGRSTRRRILEHAWIALTVLYGAGRAVVVGAALGRYGVNPWIYAAIDISTSFFLGLATARAVGAAIDRQALALRRWALLAVAMFFAPDLAIVVMGGHRLPPIVYVVLAGIVTITASASVRSAMRKIRVGSAARAAASAALPQVTGGHPAGTAEQAP